SKPQIPALVLVTYDFFLPRFSDQSATVSGAFASIKGVAGGGRSPDPQTISQRFNGCCRIDARRRCEPKPLG
ncbi:MAG: hypothetical protein AAF889_07275, partial [Cyanobacteria bacterium P01_D01_bin.73]